MRITTDDGISLGFTLKNEKLGEIAFYPHPLAPKEGSILRINDVLWKVQSVKPSKYVKNIQIGSLCPV